MRSGKLFGKSGKFGKIFLNFRKIRVWGFSLMHFVHHFENSARLVQNCQRKPNTKNLKPFSKKNNHSAALRRSHKLCMVIHNFRALKIALGPIKKIKKKLFLTTLNLFYNIHYVISYVARGPKMAKMGPPPLTSI